MLEENVEVKCLNKDVTVVKELAAQVQREFNETSSIQTKITVNERQFLNDSDIGGIYVTSNNGRIVCNNTLAARLEYSVQKLLPDIRFLLFEQGGSAGRKGWFERFDFIDLIDQFICLIHYQKYKQLI